MPNMDKFARRERKWATIADYGRQDGHRHGVLGHGHRLAGSDPFGRLDWVPEKVRFRRIATRASFTLTG